MSDIYTLQRPNTDDFLAHFGIKGMKWGVRKARVTGGRTGRPATVAPTLTTAPRAYVSRAASNYRQERIASGQAMIGRAGNSTGRAVLHLAGRHVAESVLLSAGKMATRAIPNTVVAKGVRGALDGVHIAITIKDINDGVKIAQANAANKSNTHSRGRRKSGASK